MPASPLNDNLCWLLSRASQGLSAELGEALREVGLSTREHMVLEAAAGGGHSHIEIARAVGLDKTTMVATVDELERSGLVERARSPTDRRVYLVEVTGEGRRKLREAAKVMDAVRDDVLAHLPARQREEFLGALTALVSERLAQRPG